MRKRTMGEEVEGKLGKASPLSTVLGPLPKSLWLVLAEVAKADVTQYKGQSSQMAAATGILPFAVLAGTWDGT